MSRVLTRVKELNLPEGKYVVIGSGLLDALGLRTAHDLDLAVSDDVFRLLAKSGVYTQEVRYGADVLIADDIEIWRQWQDDLPFQELVKNTVTVEGVFFAHPTTIIDRKRARGLEKDLNDIRLLKEYYSL